MVVCLVNKKCVMDSCFTLPCWVKDFWRMVSVTYKLHLSFLHIFLLKMVAFSILICSFVSQEASGFPAFFWMREISLVKLRLCNTNARNFSFTFIICPLIINENMIDFWSRRERKKEWYLDISCGLLLTPTRIFDLGNENFLSRLMVGYTPFTQTHTIHRCLTPFMVKSSLTSHMRDILLLLKKHHKFSKGSPHWYSG